MHLENGARGLHVPRKVSSPQNEFRGSPEAEKGKKMDLPLRASRRNQPGTHLYFSPVKPILEF